MPCLSTYLALICEFLRFINNFVPERKTVSVLPTRGFFSIFIMRLHVIFWISTFNVFSAKELA